MTFWKKMILDLSEILLYLFLFVRIFLGRGLLRPSSSFIKLLIIYLPNQSQQASKSSVSHVENDAKWLVILPDMQKNDLFIVWQYVSIKIKFYSSVLLIWILQINFTKLNSLYILSLLKIVSRRWKESCNLDKFYSLYS